MSNSAVTINNLYVVPVYFLDSFISMDFTLTLHADEMYKNWHALL
jgi:hypothetical protein